MEPSDRFPNPGETDQGAIICAVRTSNRPEMNFGPFDRQPQAMPLMPAPPPALSAETRRALLQFVRVLSHWVLTGGGEVRPGEPSVEGQFGGAFVTFYRGRSLRGCMGTFLSTNHLTATLEEVTHSSLTDPRFETDPITLKELPELTIEISILTAPQRTDQPLALVPGTHGIIVRQGSKSGCFLPKVARERRWNAEQFLSQCCTLKAGLPAGAWREPGTEVYLFCAEELAEQGVSVA